MAVYAIAWVLINVMLMTVFGSAWDRFLQEIPVALTLGGFALCASLLIIQINKMLKEDKSYAVA
jgi:hypothetical protein